MKHGRWMFLVMLLMVHAGVSRSDSFREDFDAPSLDPTKWNFSPGDGALTLVDGTAILSAPGGRFPFLVPVGNPFPDGDWSLKVRFRYPTVATCGNGFQSTRENVDLFAVSGFSFWQDLCCGPIRVTIGDLFPVYLNTGVDTSFHEYEWQRFGNTYTFYLDGALVGMDQSDLRPTGFFFGHPPGTTCSTWTSEMIDFIRIAAIGPTPANSPTWGALKSHYR